MTVRRDTLVANADVEATVKNLSDHEADASLPTLSFRFFDASEGKVYSVKPADGKVYAFENDAIIGTDVNPVILQNSYDYVQAINFTALDQMPHDGQWYNVGGVLIGKKPTQSGVYIYNGKAVVVK